ncbi:MAG: hypothetical protein ABIF09_07485 [Gemmatimonadota bacterium]
MVCAPTLPALTALVSSRIFTIGDTVVVRTLSGDLWRDTANLVPEVSIGMFDGSEDGHTNMSVTSGRESLPSPTSTRTS